MRRTLSVAVALGVATALIAPGAALAHRRHHHRWAHPVHVEATFTYEDGTARALVGDRGGITAIDDAALTLVRPDDVEVTVARTDDICVRLRGRLATWEDLAVGMRIAAIAEPSAAGGLAGLVIHAGTPMFVPPLPNCGLFVGAVHGDGTATYVEGTTRAFSWDRGRITGLGVHRIRIHRPDGVGVTAEVDRLTAVRGVRSYRALHLGDPVWMISVKVDGDPAHLLARLIQRIHR